MSTRLRRGGLVLSLTSVLVTAGAAHAAAITKIRISVSATVTRHVHVTQDDYACPGASASGDMTETVSVTTYRPSTQLVIPGVGTRISIEPQTDRNDSGETLTRGMITRTSTLGAKGEAQCGEDPATCGTHPFSVLRLVGGADDGPSGRRFRGIEFNGGREEDYRDPFTSCGTPNAVLPLALDRTVAFPVGLITSCRRGKVTRKLSSTDSFTDPYNRGTHGDTTLTLKATVSRLGPLRGYRC